MPTDSELFADLLNRTHEMLEWPDDRLAGVQIDLGGKRCGFAASVRWLTSRLHTRAVEVHNHINNPCRK